jgi:PTH2 family peptidyl-tRNA hydrolase
MSDTDNVPKQVIIFRKDLRMRTGKIAAQCAHAAMKDLLSIITYCGYADAPYEVSPDEEQYQFYFGEPLCFKKIVLTVDSEAELLDIYKEAQDKGLRAHLITDRGLTEFNGVPTNTCICIGPHSPEKIDAITQPRNLKLA